MNARLPQPPSTNRTQILQYYQEILTISHKMINLIKKSVFTLIMGLAGSCLGFPFAEKKLLRGRRKWTEMTLLPSEFLVLPDQNFARLLSHLRPIKAETHKNTICLPFPNHTQEYTMSVLLLSLSFLPSYCILFPFPLSFAPPVCPAPLISISVGFITSVVDTGIKSLNRNISAHVHKKIK